MSESSQNRNQVIAVRIVPTNIKHEYPGARLMVFGPHGVGDNQEDFGPTNIGDGVRFENDGGRHIGGSFVIDALEQALVLPPWFIPRVFPFEATIRGEPIFLIQNGQHIHIGYITKLEDGTFIVILEPGFTFSVYRRGFHPDLEERWHRMTWNQFLDENPVRFPRPDFGERFRRWWYCNIRWPGLTSWIELTTGTRLRS